MKPEEYPSETFCKHFEHCDWCAGIFWKNEHPVKIIKKLSFRLSQTCSPMPTAAIQCLLCVHLSFLLGAYHPPHDDHSLVSISIRMRSHGIFFTMRMRISPSLGCGLRSLHARCRTPDWNWKFSWRRMFWALPVVWQVLTLWFAVRTMLYS